MCENTMDQANFVVFIFLQIFGVNEWSSIMRIILM